MTNRETKLTLADIQKNADALNKKQKFYIDKDQGKFIYYYPKFSKRKITILISDLANTIEYVQQNKLDFFQNDHELNNYILFLIIKHFTDLQSELKDKPIETHFATMNHLVDIGWYELFLTDMFTIHEISNVLEEISKRLNLSIKYLELEKELTNLQANVDDISK
ncbi:hypothetical protein ACIQXF_04635 [Lysinibacillus sp. NPDC097231]|uniref:hypothetical protein n=1 Tax=Lysinibacillus sp. NPDC097231 TaxID=3364142 RepID=UPI00383088A0